LTPQSPAPDPRPRFEPSRLVRLPDSIVVLVLCACLISSCKEMDEVFAPAEEMSREAREKREEEERNEAENSAALREQELARRVATSGRTEDLGPEPAALGEKTRWLIKKRLRCENADCSDRYLRRLRVLKRVGPELLTLVRPAEPMAVQLEALRLVGLLGKTDMAPGLAQQLSNPSARLRKAACTSLAWLKADAVAVEVAERLRHVRDRSERVCLMGALAAMNGPVSLKWLSKAAASRSVDEALTAVRGLGTRSEPAAARALEQAIALSESGTVKRAALEAVARMKSRQGKAVLRRASRSPDAQVRKLAEELLAKQKKR
jgi:hypothetical protein